MLPLMVASAYSTTMPPFWKPDRVELLIVMVLRVAASPDVGTSPASVSVVDDKDAEVALVADVGGVLSRAGNSVAADRAAVGIDIGDADQRRAFGAGSGSPAWPGAK